MNYFPRVLVTSMVNCIYSLIGKNVSPFVTEETIKDHIDFVFQVCRKNRIE